MENKLVIEKKKLRAALLKKLDILDTNDFNDLSLKISNNLIIFLNSENVIQEKKIIGAFAPIKKEPLIFNGLNEEFLKNIQFAFPAIDDQKEMIFKLSKFDELELKTDFGTKILGPNLKAELVVPEILLIPGLAFTLTGKRLGRGKGYFDKYLTHFAGLKVGICLEMQVLKEVPFEEHDIEMDYLITEKNIYKI